MNRKKNKLQIGIIDYGMGNIKSVSNAIELLGCDALLIDNPKFIKNPDAIILPGVGAFGEAMKSLNELCLIDPIKEVVLDLEKPLLGICLGMQLLATSSEENGKNEGLSFIPGTVKKIPQKKSIRLPHVGWNEIELKNKSQIFNDIKNRDSFYFVHSYRLECEQEYVLATTNYGEDIIASVQSNNIFGMQFHPERSQQKGLHSLNNFINFVNKKC